VALARGAPARRETEGTRAARSGARLGQKLGVRTPILDAVVAVAYEAVPAAKAAARLLETVAPGMEDE
jgi:glycerol-3-phosphate dehydrogenase